MHESFNRMWFKNLRSVRYRFDWPPKKPIFSNCTICFWLYCTKEYRWFVMNRLCLCVQIHFFFFHIWILLILSQLKCYRLKKLNFAFSLLSPSLPLKSTQWKSKYSSFFAIDILNFFVPFYMFSEKTMPSYFIFCFSSMSQNKMKINIKIKSRCRSFKIVSNTLRFHTCEQCKQHSLSLRMHSLWIDDWA